MRKEFFIWALAVLLVVAVAVGYAQQRNMHARYVEFRENEKRLEEVRREINTLRGEVDAARKLVENLENDPVEKEAAVRRIRRLTRPGEVIFRIENEPEELRLNPPESSAPAPAPEPAPE